MKITLTGAHRTGKTTLTEKLQEALPEYEVRDEAFYELEETGFAFSEIPSPEEYLILLEHSIEQITAAENENIIFDRCPLDMLAYILATDDFESINIKTLYERVKDAMSETDLLVFVPVEVPDRIGCPSSELPELRQKVNEILNDWVWDFNTNAIEVSGSPSVRRDQIIRIIKQY